MVKKRGKSSVRVNKMSGGSSKPMEPCSPQEAELSDVVSTGIRLGMDCIHNLMKETLPKFKTDEMRQSVAKRLEMSLLKLIKAEMSYKEASSTVNKVVEEMPDDLHSEADAILQSCDEISRVSHERIREYENELTDDKLKEHVSYGSLKQEMELLLFSEEVEEGECEVEQDLEAVQEKKGPELIPDIDPITKHPLKDPVRNSVCNHIYGKASITELIRSNPKIRCPSMGCPNKEFIRVEHLVYDAKLAAKVRRKVRDAARNAK